MTLRGKGAFVTSRAVTRWDAWLGCGLEWCALQHAWTWGDQRGPVGAGEVSRTARELVDESFRARARGSAPWWWAWVVPSRVGPWLDRLAEDLALAGEAAPEGIILNLELAEPGGARGRGRSAWNDGPGVAAAAARLVAGVRAVWPGEVWITTHGLLKPRQPWGEFSDFDGVLPQAYNPSCTYEAGFVSRCVASYDAAFPEPGQIAPLLGANSTPAECMARFAREAEECRPAAVGWWAWTGIEPSPAKRAVVAACGVKAPPPQ